MTTDLLLITISLITALTAVKIYMLNKDIKRERTNNDKLIQIITPYLNELPNVLKLDLKRELAIHELEIGTIKSIADAYPVMNELSIEKGQNTLLIGATGQGKSLAIKNWIAKIGADHIDISDIGRLEIGSDISSENNVFDLLSFIQKEKPSDIPQSIALALKIIDKACNEKHKHLFIIVEEFGFFQNHKIFLTKIMEWLTSNNEKMTFVFTTHTYEEANVIQRFCKTYCFRCLESKFPIEVQQLKPNEFLHCEYIFESEHSASKSLELNSRSGKKLRINPFDTEFDEETISVTPAALRDN
jgi:hypothetical protein